MSKKIKINVRVNELANVFTVECVFDPREDMEITVSDTLDIKHLARIPEIVSALERCVLEICRGDSDDVGIH